MKTAHLWECDQKIAGETGGLLAGIDEAGRGPLAGAVVAACVVLNLKNSVEGVRDSKKIPEEKRETIYEAVMASALHVGVGEASVEEIDKLNILQATFLAMRRAVDNSGCVPALVLVDGNHQIPYLAFTQRAMVRGDGTSATIAAASIVAKVTRDRQMLDLHQRYPEYGFDRNKGYGSQAHIQAIRVHGMSPVHRKSFKPRALSQTELFAK